MAYISTEQMAHRITEILATADLNTITAKQVRRQLEYENNTNLNSRKQEIDNLIMACLNNMQMGAAAAAAGMSGLTLPPHQQHMHPQQSQQQSQQQPPPPSQQQQQQMQVSQALQQSQHPGQHMSHTQQQSGFMLPHQMPNMGQPAHRMQTPGQQLPGQQQHILPLPVTTAHGLPPPPMQNVFSHAMHQQPGFPSPTSHQHNVMAAALAQNPSMVLPPPMQQPYVLPPGTSVQMATSVGNSLLGGNSMNPNTPTSATDATGKLLNIITQNQLAGARRRPLSSQQVEDEEEKPKKVSKKAKSRKKPPQNLDPNRPKRATPLTKPMRLSPDLMAVVGVAELGRAQVVKAIWGYIRQYNLQDPNDKRYFTTDDKLRVIFNGLQRLNCFEMNKYLSAHLSKIETDTTPNQSPASTSVSSSRKTMTPSTTDTNTDIQSPAMPGGHIYHPLSPTTPDDPFGSITRSEWELVKPMRLSADLAAIVGTHEMGRALVVKAVWTYIRQCNLQDPNDKRYFTTDDKLRVIFNGLHRMSCFEINQYLESHLTEIETDTPGQNNLGTRLTAANSDPTSIDVTAAAAAAVAGLQGTHMASGHPHHLLNLTSSMDPLVSSASVVPDYEPSLRQLVYHPRPLEN